MYICIYVCMYIHIYVHIYDFSLAARCLQARPTLNSINTVHQIPPR